MRHAFASIGRLNFAVPVLAVLVFLAACAGAPEESGRARASTGTGYETVGTASFYGARFHGRTTASGEPFDMNAMTAAHRDLPFGTRVRVTNLDNGKSVVLRINDRGPFVKGRIIDVSRHAAIHLDFLEDGLAKVRVEVI